MSKLVNRIEIDLSTWTDHYPTGCCLFDGSDMIDSQYCDNANEFISFIDWYKNDIDKHVVVNVIFDGYDLDNETAMECAKEVYAHIIDIVK